MILKLILKDVEMFQASFSELVVLKPSEPNTNLFRNNFDKAIYSTTGYFSFNIFNEKIFIYDYSTLEVLQLDSDLVETVLFKEVRSFFSFNRTNFFLLSDIDFVDKSVTKDFPNRKKLYKETLELWENSDWGQILLFDNDLVLLYTSENKFDSNRYSFSKLNFLTGIKEWNFDLEQHFDKLVSAYPFDQPLQVKEPLGVYKDQLWFFMSNYGLLCLNNNTGEFMHYLRDCPENPAGHIYLPYGGYPVIPFTENAVLLAEEGKIVCFDNMFYWQLDLETLELDFHFLEDYFKDVDCYTFRTRFKKLIVEGRKIYMVASKSNKFACFNRDTLKYDWIESLPENSGSPRSVEKHGNKLYIDTSRKELLVYEMED